MINILISDNWYIYWIYLHHSCHSEYYTNFNLYCGIYIQKWTKNCKRKKRRTSSYISFKRVWIYNNKNVTMWWKYLNTKVFYKYYLGLMNRRRVVVIQSRLDIFLEKNPRQFYGFNYVLHLHFPIFKIAGRIININIIINIKL